MFNNSSLALIVSLQLNISMCKHRLRASYLFMDDAFLKESNHRLWTSSILKFKETPNPMSAINCINIDLYSLQQ